MLVKKAKATGQTCRTCRVSLSSEFLQTLAESPDKWLPCPGHFCSEYWRERNGHLEQQKAVVLRRQLLI